MENSKPIYTHCSDDLNDKVAELMEDYANLVKKAKSYGLDIRLYDTSVTLELYYNDDYPDTLLVDKDLSSEKRKDDITDEEWDKAIAHLNMYIVEYASIGWAGQFGLNGVLVPLKKRYDSGERTRELYDAIMEVE